MKIAFEELKAIGAPVFERSDYPERFLLSAEENDTELWADYYQPDFGLFGVNLIATNIMDKQGLFFEWETPGALIAYEV